MSSDRPAGTIESINNFRELGGLVSRSGRRIASGRVYRSGHLAAATDADLDELQRLGITLIIDLRGPVDIEYDGDDRLPSGATRMAVPMEDPFGGSTLRGLFASGDTDAVIELLGDGKAERHMQHGAAQLVAREDRAQQFGDVLRAVAHHDGAALIHCTAGKDRTGWACSALLLLLDVAEHDVLAHYLESNNRYRPPQRAAPREPNGLPPRGLDPSIVAPMVSVRESYFRSSADALEQRWGGLERYARDGLKLDTETLDKLQRRLITTEPRGV